jgi:hypothetical protein
MKRRKNGKRQRRRGKREREGNIFFDSVSD